ncbi:MAG: phospho-N-acetylmuramoyl-pentapeptide-transferase [Candidatus Magasanikbacteria bacterium]
MEISLLQTSLLFFIGACLSSFLFAPILTKILYKFNITRRSDYDFTLYGDRQIKVGTPIMGGLLVILITTAITLIFNWNRKYTYVPMGVMGIAALLGAADDLLNIFGEKRRLRTLKQTITLIKIHHHWYMRVWYVLIMPWEFFKHLASMLGSHPGRGIQVHEKLLFQFLAGAVAAWWVYTKLDPSWHSLAVPFDGRILAGIWIVPIIIFFVMFTANAVNIADGLDGLAGGSLLITFVGLTVISWIEGRTAFAPLNATVAGCLLAYTYFNIKPARFQMGDVGSLGLGALLAINMISIDKTLYIPIFGFIFYLETIVVILQVFSRRLFGRRLFKMAPLHHHLEFNGWGEEKIVMRFWIIHALVVVVGILMTIYK